MRKQKLALICLMSIGILLIMAGCLPFLNTSKKSTGQLKIVVDIPEEFRSDISSQFISYKIKLAQLKITLKHGEIERIQTIDIDENTEEAVIDDLEAWAWDVKVVAIDVDGYDVLKGSKTVEIESDALTTIDIQPELEPGNLEVKLTVPERLDASTGEVILINLLDSQQNLQKEMIFEGNIGTTIFEEIQSTTWPLMISLYNAQGDEIGYVKEPVDVMPGRVTTVTVEPSSDTGELEISIDWGFFPSAPN